MRRNVSSLADLEESHMLPLKLLSCTLPPLLPETRCWPGKIFLGLTQKYSYTWWQNGCKTPMLHGQSHRKNPAEKKMVPAKFREGGKNKGYQFLISSKFFTAVPCDKNSYWDISTRTWVSTLDHGGANLPLFLWHSRRNTSWNHGWISIALSKRCPWFGWKSAGCMPGKYDHVWHNPNTP